LAAQREQLVATHKVTIESHANYLKVEEAGKELILYAVGNDALAPLKKQYIGFGDETVLLMIVHLRTKTAIKMTTAQKHEYCVPHERIQHTMGPNDEHHSVFHHVGLLPDTAKRLWHRNKRGREMHGGGGPNVDKQNVHRRTNARVGK
jgi:hypothetical protein